MCVYLSFLQAAEDPSDVRFCDLESHSATRVLLGIPTDWGAEVEWQKDDDGASLTVRVSPDSTACDADGERLTESSYRAAILAKWPTRSALELALMGDADSYVRWHVAQRVAPEHLVAMMGDADANVRWHVARRIAPEHLPEMMGDADVDVRLHVARRIAPEHLPAMMGDSDANVRRHVARRIAPEHLPEMMGDADSYVRLHVARRIAPEHLPAMMGDSDVFVRWCVAERGTGKDCP